MERLAIGEAVQEKYPMSIHGGVPVSLEVGTCGQSNFYVIHPFKTFSLDMD